MTRDLGCWKILVPAIAAGIAILWIDTRPGWDDTGITVSLILMSSAILGFSTPKRAWLMALAVGIWIPLWYAVVRNSFSPAFALVVAFVGAYVGAMVRWLLLRRN